MCVYRTHRMIYIYIYIYMTSIHLSLSLSLSLYLSLYIYIYICSSLSISLSLYLSLSLYIYIYISYLYTHTCRRAYLRQLLMAHQKWAMASHPASHLQRPPVQELPKSPRVVRAKIDPSYGAFTIPQPPECVSGRRGGVRAEMRVALMPGACELGLLHAVCARDAFL